MAAPRISGPPRVIGWDEENDVPRIEVPVNPPPDDVWASCLAQFTGGDHGRAVRVQRDEPALVLLPGGEDDVRQALEWLAKTMPAIAEEWARRTDVIASAQFECDAWWNEANGG